MCTNTPSAGRSSTTREPFLTVGLEVSLPLVVGREHPPRTRQRNASRQMMEKERGKVMDTDPSVKKERTGTSSLWGCPATKKRAGIRRGCRARAFQSCFMAGGPVCSAASRDARSVEARACVRDEAEACSPDDAQVGRRDEALACCPGDAQVCSPAGGGVPEAVADAVSHSRGRSRWCSRLPAGTST